MYNNTTGIFKVVLADKNASGAAKFRIEKSDLEFYPEPPRIFGTKTKDGKEKLQGNVKALSELFWKSFTLTDTSMGVMLVGGAGLGKTTLSELLCNKGLKVGLPVIEITEIPADIDLVRFIDDLPSCIVLLDEFSKNFDIKLQEQMLRMFSSSSTIRTKLFIISENNKYSISRYLRNRIKRFRYCINFERIDEDTLHEYLEYYNTAEWFKEEVKEKYKSALEFSNDHIEGLIEEHLRFPNMTMEDLLYVLNLDVLSGKAMLKFENIINIKTNEAVDPSKIHNVEDINRLSFNRGMRVYINFRVSDGEGKPERHLSLYANKNKIILLDEDNKKMEVKLNDDYKAIFRTVTE